jgi:excisionase family DNA binding protein
MNYEQASGYLSVTPRMLRRLWAERRVPAVKVGSLVRFDRADLDRYIEASRVEAVRGPLGRRL